jgi:hypothetical protein
VSTASAANCSERVAAIEAIPLFTGRETRLPQCAQKGLSGATARVPQEVHARAGASLCGMAMPVVGNATVMSPILGT